MRKAAGTRVAIGSDHGGFDLKRRLVRSLEEDHGIVPLDCGCHSTDAVDYPDLAVAVARALQEGRVDLGVMIDAAGIGSTMTLNRLPGIRAALCHDTFTAVKDFLDGRQAALAELASSGSTDPVEISRAAQKLREGLQALASRSDYVRALLEQAEASDRSLASIAPTPRAIREEPEAPPAAAEEEADADEAEVSA